MSGFRAEGLPVETRWSTALAANWLGWWLDPQSKDFGPNAKYYRHDIVEGKKLLSAAGYPNGIQNLLSNYIPAGRGQPTPVNPKFPEVLDGMVSDIGITTKVNTLDYTSEYISQYRDGQGQYEGWTYHSVSGGIATRLNPVSALAAEYWSKSGIIFRGFSASGQDDKSGDPQVNALIEKARVEQDTEKRKTLVYDHQRYLAKSMYGLVVARRVSRRRGHASGISACIAGPRCPRITVDG